MYAAGVNEYPVGGTNGDAGTRSPAIASVRRTSPTSFVVIQIHDEVHEPAAPDEPDEPEEPDDDARS
jgi:hypothetical protein